MERLARQGRTYCPFYNEIDMILGNRAASSPTVLIESGGDSSIVSEVELNDGQLEGTHNFCCNNDNNYYYTGHD